MRPSQPSKLIVFAAMGMELVGLILAAIWLGFKIDETYRTKGLALIGLMVLVLIGWLVQIIYLLKRIPDDEVH